MNFSIYTPHEDANGNVTEVRTTVPITCTDEIFVSLYEDVIVEAEDTFGIALDAYGDDQTVEYEIADHSFQAMPLSVSQKLVDEHLTSQNKRL